MITLFKNITYEITDREKLVLMPMLLQILQNSHCDNRITGRQLCVWFRAQGHQVTGSRLRKMVNYIRVTNAAKPAVLIGASNGYFYSTDVETIRLQIESVRGRIDSMTAFLDTMEAQMQTLKHNQSCSVS